MTDQLTKTEPTNTAAATVTSEVTPEQHLFKLLDQAGEMNVSDVHVHPDDGFWLLTSDSFFHVEDHHIPQWEILQWLRASKSGDAKKDDPFAEKGHASAAFDTGTWRVRGTFRQSESGVSCTFRLIPKKIRSADELGLPAKLQDLVTRSSGLLLVEGPTGSGKTTAIAALIDLINRTTAQHIYLVEHPIEFVHERRKSLFTQREIGIHAPDYATALEDALRSKPNVILIGEMLNPATARAVLHAATTGHLVITTAHAGSVTEALDSFIGQFTADEQPQIRNRLSQSLLGVMVQRLVPKVGGGKTPVRELMFNDYNTRDLINNGRLDLLRAQLENREQETGSFSLEEDLTRLVGQNIITPDTALQNAKSLKDIEEKLSRIGHQV